MSVTTNLHHQPGARALMSALALTLLLAAGCSEKQEAMAPQEAAPAQEAAEPMATAEAEAPAPAAEAPAAMAAAEEPAAETMAAAADGEKTYKASCQVCHAAGVAGAPKLGDKDAWAPRIAKGNDALLASVKNGLNAMPPKGGCMNCSDEDLRAAMVYMVEQGS